MEVACLRYRLRFDHFLVNICKTYRGAATIFNLVIWNWFSILLAQQEFPWLNYSASYNGVGNKSGVWTTTTCHQRLFATGVVGSTFSKWTSKNRPQVIWTVSLMGPLCFEVGNRCFDGDFCKLTFSPAHLILECIRCPDYVLLYPILFFNSRYRKIV